MRTPDAVPPGPLDSRAGWNTAGSLGWGDSGGDQHPLGLGVDGELSVRRSPAGVPESEGDQDCHDTGQGEGGDRCDQGDGGEGAEGVGLEQQTTKRGALEHGLHLGFSCGVSR